MTRCYPWGMANNNRPSTYKTGPIINDSYVAQIELHARKQGVRPAKLAAKAGFSASAWSGWKLNKTRIRPEYVEKMLQIEVPKVVREWLAL